MKESTSAPAHLNIAWSSSPAIKESFVLFQIDRVMSHCINDRSCASSINTTSNFGDLSDLVKSKIMSLKSIKAYSFLYLANSLCIILS